MRKRSPRGFTFIELMVALSIGGILLATASWAISRVVSRGRATSAAQRLTMDIRSAKGTAARLNRSLQMVISRDDPRCGGGPSYRIETMPVAGQPQFTYTQVCLRNEYPGVVLGAGGVDAEVSCPADEAMGHPPLPACSLCGIDARLGIFPSGELRTPEGMPNGATMGFTSQGNDEPAATAMVSIRNISGATRFYRANADSDGWECP